MSYLPTYLPSTYICSTYLPIYLPSTNPCATFPPTYLLSYHLPTYIYLFIYLLIIYLCTYLPILIYVSTYLLSTYIPTYSLHKWVCTCKNIGRQAHVPTYLPSYLLTNLFMKKNEIEMLLYTLIKEFMEVQGNMLNPFGIILFYKVVRWFDG